MELPFSWQIYKLLGSLLISLFRFECWTVSSWPQRCPKHGYYQLRDRYQLKTATETDPFKLFWRLSLVTTATAKVMRCVSASKQWRWENLIFPDDGGEIGNNSANTTFQDAWNILVTRKPTKHFERRRHRDFFHVFQSFLVKWLHDQGSDDLQKW